MKWTRANVEVYAKQQGFTPVQVDSIPEGFSFKAPDLTIGDEIHQGKYMAFVPNSQEPVIAVKRPEELLHAYKLATI